MKVSANIEQVRMHCVAISTRLDAYGGGTLSRKVRTHVDEIARLSNQAETIHINTVNEISEAHKKAMTDLAESLKIKNRIKRFLRIK